VGPHRLDTLGARIVPPQIQLLKVHKDAKMRRKGLETSHSQVVLAKIELLQVGDARKPGPECLYTFCS
jgi:hypothetical protein